MWSFLLGVKTGSSFKFQTTSFPDFLKMYYDQSFKISFTRETSLGFSMIFILGREKKEKLLAAALFVSDGYTVYILKHLECEQLPLLLSHQVSYSLYKLSFYYQRNVSLPLLFWPPWLCQACSLKRQPAHPQPAGRWSLSTIGGSWQHTQLRLNRTSQLGRNQECCLGLGVFSIGASCNLGRDTLTLKC